MLQQCLPFTVLKPLEVPEGVELQAGLQQCLPFTVLKLLLRRLKTKCHFRYVATVLTVYGIETPLITPDDSFTSSSVATVLTVYGIETCSRSSAESASFITLQQCLPFTVLKPSRI